MTVQADPGSLSRSAAAGHHLNAFGLEVHSEWPLPGSTPTPTPNGACPATRLRLVAPEQLDAAWAEPAEQLGRREDSEAEAYLTVDRTDRHYRLWLRGCGRYLVSFDGTEVGCERGPFAQERRDRYVLAQVLPLAAVLQGFEVLHASAVRVGTEAIGFVGASGTGKTSLASRLVLRGAGLVADDVVALRLGDDAPIAYPGTPFLMCREEDMEALEASAGRLGPVVGSSDKLHVSVATVDRPLPLRSLYFLERGDALQIEALERGNVRQLLACVFVSYHRTSERLQRHLETAMLINETVGQFRLRVPRNALQDAVEAVEAHLGEREGRC